MAITDIDISETLEAGAPSIEYSGTSDPNQMMASQPNPEAEMNNLSLSIFGKSLNELTEDELEYLNIQMQDRYGLRKPGGIENILVAGGGERGWRAQMLAEDLAQEQYGKEFYDLSHDLQMEVYTIALDMIDSGGHAEGGRVGYGLGSFVKKIGKGIKKIVKSPVGKAALLTLGGAGLMGAGPLGGMLGGAGQGIAGFFGKGSFNPFKALIGQGTADMGLGPSKFGQMLGKMGTGSKVGIGTALATYLGSQGMEEEQIEEVQRDPNKLRPYLRDLFKKLNPSLPDGQIEEMVETNVSEYATGGRVGLKDGFLPTPQNEPDFREHAQQKATQVENLRMINKRHGDLSAYIDSMKQGENTDKLRKKLMEETKDAIARAKGERSFAQGGRIGLADGFPNMDEYMYRRRMMEWMNRDNKMREEYEEDKRKHKVKEQKTMVADGGRIGLALGSEDTAQAASLLGNLPLRQNSAGITELDLRETGGFIPPVGVKEKADDVPAMLSNNEFVWTADAVRAAGGGSVNKGAQILHDQMKQLESKVV